MWEESLYKSKFVLRVILLQRELPPTLSTFYPQHD